MTQVASVTNNRDTASELPYTPKLGGASPPTASAPVFEMPDTSQEYTSRVSNSPQMYSAGRASPTISDTSGWDGDRRSRVMSGVSSLGSPTMNHDHAMPMLPIYQESSTRAVPDHSKDLAKIG